MKEIRITKNEDSYLPKLYSEWWSLVAINDFKFYLEREIPKKKPSTALTVKTGTNTLNFLQSCFNRSENSRIWWEDNWISQDTLFEFSDYWLEKGENDKKHRFEKEKVFDVKKRLRTWISKPFNSNKKERWVTILD